MRLKIISAFLLLSALISSCGDAYKSETVNNTSSSTSSNSAVIVNNTSGSNATADSSPTTSSSSSNQTAITEYEKNKNGGYQLPTFPFPPNASVDYPIDASLLKNSDGQTTLGYVDDKLRQALSANGYDQTSYYSVGGGFVITTAMEQFKPNGEPESRNRFDDSPSSPGIFDSEFWLNSLQGKKGRYRVIAFMITNRNINDDHEVPTYSSGKELVVKGAKFLPAEMRPLAFTAQHRCLALIYEYGQDRKTGEIKYLRPGTMSAKIHLKNLLGSLRRG